MESKARNGGGDPEQPGEPVGPGGNTVASSVVAAYEASLRTQDRLSVQEQRRLRALLSIPLHASLRERIHALLNPIDAKIVELSSHQIGTDYAISADDNYQLRDGQFGALGVFYDRRTGHYVHPIFQPLP